jgi:hypothetical protein
MPEDFATVTRPHLEAYLEPGETLQGVIAATLKKTFSGGLYAIGVTDRRLLLLPLDRKIAPKADPRFVRPEELSSVKLDGAGDGWWSTTSMVLDRAALTLRLRTTDGDKVALMMMRGGEGMLGRLGGGQLQDQGVVALADWLVAHVPRDG